MASLKFTVEHPVGRPGCALELYQQDGLTRFARAAEGSGFDAIAFTDHPAPSLKWRDAGGHKSLDPLTALAFASAVTTRISLMTYLLVLPYRNPLLSAKMIATVDVMSMGRLIVGVGNGYLRSEFRALGVDFEERGALLDEAIEVIRSLWVEDGLSFDGLHFTARDQASAPWPTQRPHPPIWIGGNGRNARRRAARVGAGWTPLLLSQEVSATTGMAQLGTVQRLADAIEELRGLMAENGRDPMAMRVQVQCSQSEMLGRRDHSWAEHRAFLGELRDAGVTDFVVRVPGDDVGAAVAALQEYSHEVLETVEADWTPAPGDSGSRPT